MQRLPLCRAAAAICGLQAGRQSACWSACTLLPSELSCRVSRPGEGFPESALAHAAAQHLQSWVAACAHSLHIRPMQAQARAARSPDHLRRQVARRGRVPLLHTRHLVPWLLLLQLLQWLLPGGSPCRWPIGHACMPCGVACAWRHLHSQQRSEMANRITSCTRCYCCCWLEQ